jgi:hypothetical protein
MVIPLFEHTKKDVAFLWNSNHQNAFDMLKNVLVKTLILIRMNLIKPFILDVDWSI